MKCPLKPRIEYDITINSFKYEQATTDFGECDPECAWLVGSADDGIEFSVCAMAKASSVPPHIRNRVIQNGN